jgi:LPXTG-motif cell wall-anchored protein
VQPLKALAALVVAALLVSAAGAPAALAADATIEGTVVNGTTARPVGNVPVTVLYFDANGKIGQANLTTDPGGRFSVTPPAAAQGYQVVATFKGAEFRSPATQLLAGQPSISKLRVFEPTTATTDVAQTDWVVWLDREGDGIAVQQDFAWANDGEKAYVGTDGAVVTVPLPPQAGNFQYLGTFLEQRGSLTSEGYVSDAPIAPGTSNATIRFTAPGTPALQFPIAFPTRSFQMFVPAGITVTSPQLRLAGTTTDQGVTYQVLTADGTMQPGDVLDATLQVEAALPQGSSSTSLLLLIAGLAALAAFAFWFLGRRRARSEQRPTGPRKPVKKPAAKPRATKAGGGNGHRAAKTTVARANGSKRAPVAADEDVDLLIDEIAALDLSFEQGVLDERTYRRLRVAAKDRLLAAQGGRELTLKE